MRSSFKRARCANPARRLPLLALLACLMTVTSGCEVLRDIIESISDGAPCSTDGECLGGLCLVGSDFPGGYCSTAACPTEGCSNIFGSECLDVPQQSGPVCFDECDSPADCRTGYDCLAIETARVCLPGAYTDSFAEAGSLGSACANNAECDSGTCLTNLVGGYCSILDCLADSECSSGRCLALDEAEGSGAITRTACYRGCSNNDACRFGYTCTDPDGDGGVCVPTADGEQTPVRNPTGDDDGQPCTVDINCKGGTCLRAEEGYPGGYCTTLDCASVGCNTPASAATDCRVITQDTACFIACSGDGQCRDSYECLGADTGEGYCAPPRATTTPGGAGDFEVVCNSTAISGGRALTFDIAASTVAFAVVPFSEAGRSVQPTRLLLPSGAVGANFNSDHSFLNVNPQIIGSSAPVFFPAAPQFASIVQQGGGTYTLEVQTTDSNPCYYVLQKASDGRNLTVNIHLVGISGLTAANARANSGFSRMLTVFERVYENAGIDIAAVNLIDAPASVADRYKIIRSFDDINRLVEAGAQTPDGDLSIDIFLIDAFAVPEAPGLLGLSLGIPGVPGAHGVSGSALMFTAEYLGSNADQVGQTMAHEVGHFNGLRHTSEHGGSEWDPLGDTAQCSNPDRGASCPDAGNLMFPFSLGDVANQETVSAGQAGVLRASPHVVP